jgi:hypothetical protein
MYLEEGVASEEVIGRNLSICGFFWREGSLDSLGF